MAIFQNLLKRRHENRYPAVLNNLTDRQLDDLGIEFRGNRGNQGRNRHMQPIEAWPKS